MDFVRGKNEIYVLNDKNEKIVLATFPFIEENVINVDHTFVDPSMRGQGIAGRLMHEVYNLAKDEGFTIVNSCPYAVAWFEKNEDKQDLLNKDIDVDEVCKI